MQRHSPALSGAALFALVLVAPARASGEGGPPDARACGEAHARGQMEVRSGHLRAAKEHFLTCARAGCSPSLQDDCVHRLDDVESALPSIVVQVRTTAGIDVARARVEVDGVSRPEAIDGLPLEIDPGSHTVRAMRDGVASDAQTVVIAEGEKRRRIVLTVAAPAPPPPSAGNVAEPRAKKTPWTVYAFGALGVAALGSFTYFGVQGLRARSDLTSCRPGCSDDAIAKARTELAVADVSLAIGLLALGVAGFVFFTQRAPAE